MTRSEATKARLMDATVQVLRDDGIAGLSARSVATRAELNQALVFYHFGTVNDLVEQACRRAVDTSLEFYRARFDGVRSLLELLHVGRELHAHERATGNVAVTAQLMAGAQQDPTLAAAARYAMSAWNREIDAVVRRVLADSALATLIDPAGISAAISAGFIGLELYEGINPEGGLAALDSLEQLGALIEVVDDLGPVASRALRARLRRTARRH